MMTAMPAYFPLSLQPTSLSEHPQYRLFAAKLKSNTTLRKFDKYKERKRKKKKKLGRIIAGLSLEINHNPNKNLLVSLLAPA